MRKPINWDWWRWDCKQHEFSQSNMFAEEKRHYCERGISKKWNPDLLKCHWNSCPKLKEIRKEVKQGKLKEPVDLDEIDSKTRIE